MTRTPRPPLLAALAVLVLLPLTLDTGLALRTAEAGRPKWESAPYRNPVHKFSLKMFRDYTAIPLQPGELDTVCKFRNAKDRGGRGGIGTSIEVVRIEKGERAGAVVTGADGSAGTPRGGPGRAGDAWEATVGRFLYYGVPKSVLEAIDRKDFKEIKSKDKPALPGMLWAFDLSLRGRGGVFVTLATFEKENIEYGIFMLCSEKEKKDYASAFVRMAKSFKYFDKRADDVEALDVLDGVNITAAKRSEIEKSMVKGWDVIVSPQKNYIIIYNTKRGTNHYLAKVIAQRIEMIREQIYEVQFPPAHPITAVCIVRVCEDAREYHAYGGPGGSAGYWTPMKEELVFYDASASKKPDDNTLSVLYHEAFHQYIHYSVGRVAPHSWFNEGHGDYYAGAKLKGKTFKIGPFNWRVGVVKNAITQGLRPFTDVTDEQGNVRKQWEPKGYTPLQDLVGFSQRQYYSYPSVSYAQGWSLIYFLREVVPRNKKYNEKWGHILDTYFDTLKREVNRERSPTAGPEGPTEPPPPPDGDPSAPGEPAPASPTPPVEPAPAAPTPPMEPAPAAPTPPVEPAPAEPAPPVEPAPAAPTPPVEPAPAEPTPPVEPAPAEPTPPVEPAPAEPAPPVEPAPSGPTAPDAPEDGDEDGGDEDGGDGEGGEPPPPEAREAPRTFFQGLGGPAALRKAVEEAFKGVDWEEFEAAWLKSTKRVK